jgi:hypothetical protein
MPVHSACVPRSPVTLAALCGLLVSCRHPTDAGDPLTCQQTYEFGNTGCVEVTGRVVGLRGQALRGISVGAVPADSASKFVGAFEMTDSDGRFRVRLIRMFGRPPMTPPDTLTVRVVAADPRSAGFGIPASVKDSARTLVTAAPVGTIPNPATVTFTLRVP